MEKEKGKLKQKNEFVFQELTKAVLVYDEARGETGGTSV